MTYYLTYENRERGYQCTRCKKFIAYEEYTSHTCECYGSRQCMNYAPVTRDQDEPQVPSEPPPPFKRNRRTKNWHLDPKYKEQWKGNLD